MNLLKPKALKKGDTIGFLSVAGNIDDFKGINAAKNHFEDLGYKVKISPNTFSQYNYMSGTDEVRLEALTEFFMDDSIDAILATRGGYGALRLLNLIDYEVIKSHPKIFAGYSDVTALSLMFYKKTGLASFSSPMAYSDFSGEPDKLSERSLIEALSGNIKRIPLLNSPIVCKEGNAQGILWGGNLTTIASLAGLDFVPDEKFILFIEDIGEPFYRTDRCLTQLLNIEKFKENLNGIILGDFSGLDSKAYFDSFFFKFNLNIPIKSGLKIGHEKQKLTIPIGVQCEFDSSKNYIEILEEYLN